MLASRIGRWSRSQLKRPWRLPSAPRNQLGLSPSQTRSFGNKQNQFDPGLGGPGGQEVYPYSQAYHREYAVETGLAVLLSGIAMYYLKRFGQFKDSISPKPVGKATILVYDDSKGVLDDVKMVRPEELGKMRVVG